MKQILWITPAGEVHTEKTSIAPTLEAMKAYVEGNIEVVSVLFHGEHHQMIVNEDGLSKQLPLNWKATSIYHCNWITREGKIPDAPIVGPAILLQGIKLD